MWCPECYTFKGRSTPFHVANVFEDDSDGPQVLDGWEEEKSKVKDKYMSARRGDHLMAPFECDLCIYRKLMGTDPDPRHKHRDELLFDCIRRMNLDAFWSRASSTVKTQARNTERGLKYSRRVRLEGPAQDPGPLPPYDHCAYEVAIQMLQASLEPGKYSLKHINNGTPFDLLQRLTRTSFVPPRELILIRIWLEMRTERSTSGYAMIPLALSGFRNSRLAASLGWARTGARTRRCPGK